METMEATQPKEDAGMVLLQCDVPASLMRRIRIAAAKRNSRAIRPIVVEALEAFVPKDESEEGQ